MPIFFQCRQIHWPQPTQTTFRCNDLLVINKVLTDLSREATQSEEMTLLKKENELLRKKEMSKNEEKDRMIKLLYGHGRLDEVEAEHDDHQTSLHSSLSEPLYGNIWESQELHNNNIFSSDEDDYSSNDEDSPIRTNIIIRENIITDEKSSFINDIEEWLNQNTFA